VEGSPCKLVCDGLVERGGKVAAVHMGLGTRFRNDLEMKKILE